MSNKYSIGGYKIAVRARSNPTLLVEGRDDKDLFNRLKLKFGSDGLVVDSTEILDDVAITGFGAKQKVDFIVSQISPDSPLRARPQK